MEEKGEGEEGLCLSSALEVSPSLCEMMKILLTQEDMMCTVGAVFNKQVDKRD